MEVTIRDYSESDYSRCEELVNQAWAFDSVFQPEQLADLAKIIYTRGSVSESTYRTVAVVDDLVVGFIFGLNEKLNKPRLHLGLRLSVLWRLFKIKSSTPNKNDLIKAMVAHEKNRAKLVAKKRSEIVLFVVAETYQGKGLGQRLWTGFLENCLETGVSKVVVETNKKGACGFYEKLGFKHLKDFDSPLHEFATPNGQACIYEYTDLPSDKFANI